MRRGEIASNVTRGAFFLGLEKGIAMVSTILYTALMARWLGPHNYGMLTVAFSIVTLATAFTGNFEMYLERYAAEHQVKGRLATLHRGFHLASGLKLALGLLVCVVLLGDPVARELLPHRRAARARASSPCSWPPTASRPRGAPLFGLQRS